MTLLDSSFPSATVFHGHFSSPSYPYVTNIRYSPLLTPTLHLLILRHYIILQSITKLGKKDYPLYWWHSSTVTPLGGDSRVASILCMQHTRDKKQSNNKTNVFFRYTNDFFNLRHYIILLIFFLLITVT